MSNILTEPIGIALVAAIVIVIGVVAVILRRRNANMKHPKRSRQNEIAKRTPEELKEKQPVPSE